MSRRRVWFARDCWLTADPRVERLADRTGAAGVLAYEEILALAKLAQDNGRVTVAYSTLARRAFLPSITKARRAVAAMVEFELFDADESRDKSEVTLTLPRYSRWQVGDHTAAERKQRERDRGSHGDVTANVTAEVTRTSRSLTVDREQKTPPNPPEGGRQRDLAAYEERLRSWCEQNFPDVPFDYVKHSIGWLRFRRTEATVERITEHLARTAPPNSEEVPAA